MAIKSKTELTELSPNVRKRQQMIGIFIALLCLGMCMAVLFYTQYQASRKVEVAWVNTSMTAGTPLTRSNIVKKSISYAAFDDYGILTNSATGEKRRAIILWSETKALENSIAGYYLRHDTPLTWDALAYEQSKDHSYLYQMDGELLKLDVNGQEFGEILVPGDVINIRVSYTDMDYSLQPEEVYLIASQSGSANSSQGLQGVSREVTELLFNNASILDILNSSGESIYDIYFNLLKQSRGAQLATLKSAEFKSKVTPAHLMLQVTPEEADRYMRIKSKSGAYLTTLLSRKDGNIILDTIADLTMELARQQQ